MPIDQAFLAIALAAVSWDGPLTPTGSRALRHALDDRLPYREMVEQALVLLVMDVLHAPVVG